MKASLIIMDIMFPKGLLRNRSLEKPEGKDGLSGTCGVSVGRSDIEARLVHSARVAQVFEQACWDEAVVRNL